MYKPLGYSIITEPDKPTIERDNTICGHCQRVVFVKPGSAATIYLILDHATLRYREEAGAFCRVCMRPICLACHDWGRCVPWERMIARMEDRDRFLRAALEG